MLLGAVSRLWQPRGRDQQGLTLGSEVRVSEAALPSLPQALTLFVTGVAVTNVSQSGLGDTAPVK